MSSTPRITHRIGDAIRRQIAKGVLAPGAPLPSTRALAEEWGVSRTTVTAAYEQLIAEGYLDARQGARTRVASGLAASSGPVPTMTGTPARLSAYGRMLASFELPAMPDRMPRIADFRYGDLSSSDFPRLAWRKAVNAALLRPGARLRYGDPRGSPRLREALQGYLWRARGLRCEADQVIVVNGSQQGLDLCARLLLAPGDRAAIEDPGYLLARQVFLATGAEVLPVPVDADGLRTDALPEARLAYTTPSHQFPLGGVLAAGRRHELLAWAAGHGAFVIEDDYDSEYRFDIAPIPPLQAMDGEGRVIYLGTASKTLSPTMRLGFLVAPPALVEAFAQAKRLSDRHSPSLEQEALAAMIETGAYERHVRRVRRRNGERRAALLAALNETMAGSVEVVGSDAGLHVVTWLNGVPRPREDAFIAAAARAGLGLYGVSAHSMQPRDPAGRAGLVMGYASLDEATILRGVVALRQVLDHFA